MSTRQMVTDTTVTTTGRAWGGGAAGKDIGVGVRFLARELKAR